MPTLFNSEELLIAVTATPFHSHRGRFQFHHILTNTHFSTFDSSHLSGCDMVSYCVIDLYFPNDTAHLYLYMFLGRSSFEKNSLQILNWFIYLIVEL